MDSRYLVLEWKPLGMGGRSLDASAKAQGGLGSRPLGPHRPGLDVGWRVLEIIRDRVEKEATSNQGSGNSGGSTGRNDEGTIP
jgi:hypothetical protein